MSHIDAPLRSLYDSLNALFSRMSSQDGNSLWVARIMLRVGEIEQNLDGPSDTLANANKIHSYAGRVSMSDPNNTAGVQTLLTELETFLATL